MISTERYSTLPSVQLVWSTITARARLCPGDKRLKRYSADGHTLYFTRWFHQWSQTKRYKGGWAENIWSFDGTHEAAPLTADYTGTSTNPMFWKGRIYFLSDRDGVMNVYSMDTKATA